MLPWSRRKNGKIKMYGTSPIKMPQGTRSLPCIPAPCVLKAMFHHERIDTGFRGCDVYKVRGQLH